MTLAEYTAALQTCDWFYAYSDDHSVWQRGEEAMQQLRAAQRQLDPQGLIWNQHAPKECRISRN